MSMGHQVPSRERQAMLTAKENMREIIKGGDPDRFVNQYEALQLLFHPYMTASPLLKEGQYDIQNAWGVYNSFPEGTPGAFPNHAPDKILIKDIERWRDYVKAPPLDFSQELWDMFKEQYDAVDDSLAYKAVFVAPGLFEQTHHFSEITNALTYYITNPDEMHDLIKYLVEWELELAEGICTNLKPNVLFHHDDWGSETSTFLRPEMFAEFFVEPYKEIYKYYHDHGVEFVFHHSDSYAATLVPYMIEMGIDVWQGAMASNDVQDLVKKYGGQISFMGGLDNKFVDFGDWTEENSVRVVKELLDSASMKHFIPCITQGGPGSVYPGVYQSVSDAIDAYNKEKFGIGDPAEQRMPLQIMF